MEDSLAVCDIDFEAVEDSVDVVAVVSLVVIVWPDIVAEPPSDGVWLGESPPSVARYPLGESPEVTK
jgi:hypothetical protein